MQINRMKILDPNRKESFIKAINDRKEELEKEQRSWFSVGKNIKKEKIEYLGRLVSKINSTQPNSYSFDDFKNFINENATVLNKTQVRSSCRTSRLLDELQDAKHCYFVEKEPSPSVESNATQSNGQAVVAEIDEERNEVYGTHEVHNLAQSSSSSSQIAATSLAAAQSAQVIPQRNPDRQADLPEAQGHNTSPASSPLTMDDKREEREDSPSRTPPSQGGSSYLLSPTVVKNDSDGEHSSASEPEPSISSDDEPSLIFAEQKLTQNKRKTSISGATSAAASSNIITDLTPASTASSRRTSRRVSSSVNQTSCISDKEAKEALVHVFYLLKDNVRYVNALTRGCKLEANTYDYVRTKFLLNSDLLRKKWLDENKTKLMNLATSHTLEETLKPLFRISFPKSEKSSEFVEGNNNGNKSITDFKTIQSVLDCKKRWDDLQKEREAKKLAKQNARNP